MAGYHNIVLPDRFSQGSTFSAGSDTRITELESGIETRMARYRPGGRRRYNVLVGIDSKDLIQALYDFYILREGALNAFKFKDWFDYATTPTRTTFQPTDAAVTAFDSDLTFQPEYPRTFQMTTTYQDAANTIRRPLTKIKQGTELIAVNGSPTLDYTLDPETGLVTIGAALGELQSVQGGCEFYVPVRFAQGTDEAFTVAMQATDSTQALPGFELIEEISPATISQDFLYGGSYEFAAPTSDMIATENNGRLQVVTGLVTSNLEMLLPGTLGIPEGGPIFIFHNRDDSVESFTVKDDADNTVATVAPDSTVMIFLGSAAGTGKFWVAFSS